MPPPTITVRLPKNPSLTDRKSTRLNSSHGYISYAVFCLKKKKKKDRENESNRKNHKPLKTPVELNWLTTLDDHYSSDNAMAQESIHSTTGQSARIASSC